MPITVTHLHGSKATRYIAFEVPLPRKISGKTLVLMKSSSQRGRKMAKRHYCFPELEELAKETRLKGFYKPGGTLGRHNMAVYKELDRFSVKGSDGSEVALYEDETLVYDCGHVWKLLPAKKIKDPVKRALREKQLPSRLIEWVDDLYPHIGRECQTSAGMIVNYRRIIVDRASMNYWSRVESVFVKKGTDRGLIVSAIQKDFEDLESIFGVLEQRGHDLSDWTSNTNFISVSADNQHSADLIFKTGSIKLFFDKAGKVDDIWGFFDSGLDFTHDQTWKGRGYTGGHVSVGSNVNNHEENEVMATLILQGRRGKDITTIGHISGYYPEVWYEGKEI